MRPPAMLATSALHLSGHRRRKIACRPGTSLGVGRGDNQGQIRYCETCRHALFRWPYAPIIIHQRWTATSRLIVHVYHPSLNIRNHFLTMPSLISFSPYTWQIWWWISLGSTFLVFKKRITDRISQSAAIQLS